jgi:hypothetical protein
MDGRGGVLDDEDVRLEPRSEAAERQMAAADVRGIAVQVHQHCGAWGRV